MVARKTDAEQAPPRRCEPCGAEFTVLLRRLLHCSNLPSEPERWTVRTDGRHCASGRKAPGVGHVGLRRVTLHGCSAGHAPSGTKAPEGYALGEQPAHVLHINASEDGTKAQIAYLDEWPAGSGWWQ